MKSTYILQPGPAALTDGVQRMHRISPTFRDNCDLIVLYNTKQRDVRRDVARAIVDRGMGLLEMRPMRMSLEDIFLRYYEPASEPVA
mgnify:CR=1 FL=1